MVETVGKKLRQARQGKRISIEDASHETRIRPEQLTALERDDYANFANITYAKGYLINYAKYLGVDVTEFVDAFANPNPVGKSDYEYLANKPAPVNSVNRINWRLWRPLAIAAVVLVVVAVIFDFIVNVQRIDLKKIETDKSPVAFADSMPVPTPAAVPQKKAPSVPSPTPAEVLPAIPGPAAPATVATAEATPVTINHTEVRRAEPVSHSDLIVPPMSSPTAQSEKAVTLQPINKTWVKITKNVQGSPPVFEDWLFPNARPLTFKGVKFWIEIRDKDAVKLTKDGEPVPYEPPGVMIQ